MRLMSNRLSLAELVDRQNEVIKMQNSIINDLFNVTLQYVSEKDIDDIASRMSRAMEIRKGLEE